MRSLAASWLGRGRRLRLRLRRNWLEIREPRELFAALAFFEVERGLAALVQALADGLVLEACRGAQPERRFVLRLDAPQAVAARAQFLEMLEDWVREHGPSFVERFYRRPALFPHPAARLLDTPLESCFKFLFGFAIRYRICAGFPGGQDHDNQNQEGI